MRHLWSIVHQFFPLKLQVREKNFLIESCFLNEIYYKTTILKKKLSTAQTSYIRVIKGQQFFFLMFNS